MGILLTLLVLTIVVVIHELGHYFVMRRNGVKVLQFGIGLPPTLFKRKMKNGVELCINLLPLGGYVLPVAEGPESVDAQSRWVRFKVYMAGMFMNATAAFVILLGIGYIVGGVPKFLIPYLGWCPDVLRIPVAAFMGSYGIWFATPFLVLYLMVTQGLAFFSGAAGPIGIIAMGNETIEASKTIGEIILGQALFLWMLNAAIAGFNLMPLAPLDGGHVTRIILEKLGASKEAVGWYWKVTAFLFIGLVIMIFASDIMKVFFNTPIGGG